ncbi:MAG: GntR family transcriptional regulator [Pseudomonadota bacterium]
MPAQKTPTEKVASEKVPAENPAPRPTSAKKPRQPDKSGLMGVPGGGLALLEPIVVRTVHESVYETLRSRIMRGSFAGGEILKIQTVAESLKTSTMPVREALARLVAEQALETMANRSVRVPVLSVERLDDLAATRAVIEGEALRRAVPHLSASDIAALSDLTDAYDAALGDGKNLPANAADLNHAFHASLYKASHSAVLMPIIESLWLQSGPYIREAAEIFGSREGPAATHHHRAIIAALEARDEAPAREALSADIAFAFALVREKLMDGPR